MRPRVLVALSGSGRSLQNLISYQREHKSFELCGVISSSSKVLGVEIAKENNLEVFSAKFLRQAKASPELCHFIESKRPDLIVLAGFLKVFPTEFNSPYLNQIKVINIHPSLLPKHSGKGMYGQKVHEAVIKSEEKESGASIHEVTPVYDEGPLISQIKVPVLKEDTADSLAKRVFAAECLLYPKTIEYVLNYGLPKKPLILES